MRSFLLIVLGMIIMFVILKVLSRSGAGSDSTNYFKALCDTPEAANLMKTNEFRELVKTPEFINLAGALAEEQVVALSKALTGIVIHK